MDKTDAKDGDIVIKLGRSFVFDDDYPAHISSIHPLDINYNFSHFLRHHDSSTDKSFCEWEANFNKFMDLLDAKVNIDPSDPRYSHIYDGIDIIVKRLVAELVKSDSFFENVTLRRTGSSISGVKVGLPHESDYVMELPRGKQLKTGDQFDVTTLFPLVQHIVAEQAPILAEGLEHWVIHGIKQHIRTGGVCLVMQCLSNENDPASDEVGVTVDLVPVYIMETTDESLNKKAAASLPHSLEEYAQKGELYRLVDETICDTGYIENNIIKQLPEDTKRAYRFCKYLIPNFFDSSGVPYSTLDKATQLRLYGLEPRFSSYNLRVFFLHLLLNVHGTEAEHRLKGGLLVLCLLNMLEVFMGRFPDRYLNHPLLKDREEVCHIRFPETPFLNFMRRLSKTNHADFVEELALINRKNKLYVDAEEFY